METENLTKEPTLEEYGLNNDSYENFRNQKINLEKELSQYKSNLENSFSEFKKNTKAEFLYSLPNHLIGWSITFGLISIWIQWRYFWIFAITLGLGIILVCFIDEDKIIEPKRKELEEKKELKSRDIIEKIKLLENKVKPFEETSVKYYQNYLNQFFNNYLYKKRSGSEKFEQYLAEFYSMINEVEKIWEKLIFTKLSLYTDLNTHKSYLGGRQIDHQYQINKKFSSFDDIKIESNNEKIEQKKEIIVEDLALDSNKKTKEEFKNNRDRKIVEINTSIIKNSANKTDNFNSSEVKDEKESFLHAIFTTESSLNLFSKNDKKEFSLVFSPEKKYRIARKIDNWEEINRKRKWTGDKGEETVFGIEREYFESINRKDLADKVRHVSKEEGDGLGYDILSFFDDGREKYIEVKSTTSFIENPFNISKNEFEFLKEHNDDAFVYRVSFSSEPPEIKVKSSPEILESEITPVSYIVKIK